MGTLARPESGSNNRNLGNSHRWALWAIVDEAALRRVVGGPGTMREQIGFLAEMARRPDITVQILPFAGGGHAAECGRMTLLRFAEPELADVVYLERLTGALYPDRTSDVLRYLDVLNRLGVQAEPPSRTFAFLEEIERSLA
ncbi:MAG TPA: DUF5753 domain-containing protein [Spirillospora sp.]